MLAGVSALKGADKAGIVGLAKCLAAELGPHGIRANALLPGGTAFGRCPRGSCGSLFLVTRIDL